MTTNITKDYIANKNKTLGTQTEHTKTQQN